jgi:hypothetical protein
MRLTGSVTEEAHRFHLLDKDHEVSMFYLLLGITSEELKQYESKDSPSRYYQ